MSILVVICGSGASLRAEASALSTAKQDWGSVLRSHHSDQRDSRSVASRQALSPVAASPQPGATIPEDILADALIAKEPLASRQPETIAQAESQSTFDGEEIDPEDALDADLGSFSPAVVLEGLEVLDPDNNLLQVPVDPAGVEISNAIPITLEQAIALAQVNNRQLQIVREQLRRDWALLRQARAQLFPTLSLQGSLSHQLDASSEISTDTQRDQLNSQIESTQTAIRTLESTIPTVTDPTQRVVLLLQLSQLQQSLESSQTVLDELEEFATTNLSGGLRVNYALYSPQRTATIRQAREQVNLSELEVQRLEEEVRLQVSNAYFDLQDADAQVLIFQADIERRQRSLSDIEALLSAGLATRLDLLNSQVELDTSQQNLLNAESQRQIAQSTLVRFLSIPPGVTVLAADPVTTVGTWELSLPETIVLALQNRVELEQRLTQRRIAEAQRRASLATIRPQVNLFATYDVLNIESEDSRDSALEGFGDGYSIGLTVNWPLFDGGAARAGARAAEANIAIAELLFADTSNLIRAETTQAYARLQANTENIQTAIDAANRADEALRIARLRFQSGVGTQSDVLDAEFRLTQAQGNVKTAVLGYNRAIAALQRAIGVGFGN